MDQSKKEKIKAGLRAWGKEEKKEEPKLSAAAQSAKRAKNLRAGKEAEPSPEPPSVSPEGPPAPEKLKKQFAIIAKYAGKFAAAPFAITAKLTGHELWNLKPAESKDLGDAMEGVVERYAPWLIRYHPELVALCFCFAALAGPRAFEEFFVRRVEKKLKKAGPGAASPGKRIKNPSPDTEAEEL